MKEDLDKDLFAAQKWRRLLVYWLRDHIRVASEVSKNMSLELSSSFLTWFILGLTVSFPAGLYLAHLNTEKAEGLVGLTGGIAIYFQTGTTESEIIGLKDWVMQNPELEVKEVRSSQKHQLMSLYPNLLNHLRKIQLVQVL